MCHVRVMCEEHADGGLGGRSISGKPVVFVWARPRPAVAGLQWQGLQWQGLQRQRAVWQHMASLWDILYEYFSCVSDTHVFTGWCICVSSSQFGLCRLVCMYVCCMYANSISHNPNHML